MNREQATRWGAIAGLAVVCACPMLHAAEPTERQPLFEGLRLERYDQEGRQRFVVLADRGYAGHKRVGFLQTALIPTVELEQVTVERRSPDGSIDTRHVDDAIIDWSTKRLVSRSGDVLLAGE